MLCRLLPLAVLLAAAPAFATVPLPLVSSGCDDDSADGFADVPADCPDDLLRCVSITNPTECNDKDVCSWDAARGSCLGAMWELISYIPARFRNRLAEPVELGLGTGIHADKAWQRTTGRFDVTIAVLDSGVRWQDRDLQNKFHLNRDELPLPQAANGSGTAGRQAGDDVRCPGADPYDHNKDCVFNVQDYADDPRVPKNASTPDDPLLGDCYWPFNNASAELGGGRLDLKNNILEPGDLLCVFSDGVDDDGNGYADDIAGWDFLWDDNNPFDDTDFGHGTGEGKDSTAEANNGVDAPGVCPNCSLIEVRVGDSFVCDSNNWAAGVVFAIDSGAKVLQSAVGGITNTAFAHAAIEYAFAKGIINVVSAADETAQHQNYPGAVEHTEYVHAIRADAESINQSKTFLNFSNCTNFGGKLLLSAPSDGCSSGATGVTSGVAGLVASAMADRIDAGQAPLSGSEIHQIFVNAVDDIDLPTSRPGHPNYDKDRYPSKEGWEAHFGYGRLNARKAVDLILDDRIPPAADLLTPTWFALLDPEKGPVDITGTATSRRGGGTWTLEYAVGLDPDDSAAAVSAGVWHSIATGTLPASGVLATWSPAAAESELDADARVESYNTRLDRGVVDDNVTKAKKVNRYTVTLRLRVEDAVGKGESRKTVYVHHDATWKPGFPLQLGGAGTSSPKLFDLDGDGRMELVLGDDNGLVHAFTAEATELAGWPVRTNAGRVVRHPTGRGYVLGPDGVAGSGDELAADVPSAVLAAVAVADLEGDGVVDVVAATLDGEVYAFTAAGALKPGFPVDATGQAAGSVTGRDAFIELGVFAAPVLADLDGDARLEIVVATLDQQVTAIRPDGSVLAGFPVSGPRDPSDLSKPFLRLPYEGNPVGQVRRIVSSPAVGDLDNDGNLEVVVGTNEAINEQISLVHAFTYDKAALRPVAYRADCGDDFNRRRCFPIQMVGGYPNALPYVGEGTPGSPVLADLDGDGKLEIGAAAIADFGRLFHHDGFDSFSSAVSAYRELKSYYGYYGADSNSGEPSSLAMIDSGTFADLDGDGVLDYFLGTAGSQFVNNLQYDGVRADFDHQVSGWSTATGEMLAGFPQVMEDLQFFLNPLVADVDGDGEAELINSSATFVVHAWRADGTVPAGWPKFTGQWQIATPALGDMDGDGLLEMAVVTRAGALFVYELEGRATGNVQWSSFRHDARNTGNYHTPDPTIVIPPPPTPPPEVCDGCCCRELSPSLLAVLAVVLVLRRRPRA
ncbi:MAG: S8 family serine peptidase [Deltaproteobacteria bacterium]|nr:S8 family serine peptidase [Deltaproteobacteria bacterium]